MKNCNCGKELKEKTLDIKTYYLDKLISIKSVRCFVCENGDIKISRLDRVKMKEKLKYAYEENLEELEF